MTRLTEASSEVAEEAADYADNRTGAKCVTRGQDFENYLTTGKFQFLTFLKFRASITYLLRKSVRPNLSLLQGYIYSGHFPHPLGEGKIFLSKLKKNREEFEGRLYEKRKGKEEKRIE